MAIPYHMPPRDVQVDYMNLDKLLTELFLVLARILERRGGSSAQLTSAILTIRRPMHQNQGDPSNQASPSHQVRPNRHGSVSDETNSDEELDVAAGTCDAEDPLPPPQLNLPDLLSHLVPARHTADCVCLMPALACRRKTRKVARTPSKKTKNSRSTKKRSATAESSSSSSSTSSSSSESSREPPMPRVQDAPVF